MNDQATPLENESKKIYTRSYLIYFFMIISASSVCYIAISNGWDYGPTTFISILCFQIFFITLERIIPYRKTWHPKAKEWLRDGVYFSLVCIAGAFGQGLVTHISTNIVTAESNIPLLLEVPAAILISTFGGYWFHRIGHQNKFLWQAHGIHHKPKKVNVANNSVTHFFDIIGPAIITQLPLIILDFSQEAIFITSVFTAMHGYFVHANIQLKLGPLSYVVATPEAHRLHHSLDLREAGNYSSDIMLWDLLFSSFTWRDSHVPKELGIHNSDSFPPTAAIHRNILHPFMYIARQSMTTLLTRQSNKSS